MIKLDKIKFVIYGGMAATPTCKERNGTVLKNRVIIVTAIVLLGLSAIWVSASSSRNCVFKAKIVDIARTMQETKMIHPDVTFGGVCYSDTYYVQIEEIELNNTVYLSTSKENLGYCSGLRELLSTEINLKEKRPIGIKLCVDKHQNPPKVDDIIDIRYIWSMGRTDTKATISWKFLSLHMDRESRKALMAKQCEDGDGSICTQLGQMYWQDQDEDGEIDSYRKACQIDKGYCTYLENALTRTGREK